MDVAHAAGEIKDIGNSHFIAGSGAGERITACTSIAVGVTHVAGEIEEAGYGQFIADPVAVR